MLRGYLRGSLQAIPPVDSSIVIVDAWGQDRWRLSRQPAATSGKIHRLITTRLVETFWELAAPLVELQ